MGILGRLSSFVDTDYRVIVLALARMVGAVGNSFLIVVLPLYVASPLINLDGLVGSAITIGGVSLSVTQPLLIGFVLSLFGFLNSLSQPWTGSLSDRVGGRKPFILTGILLLGTASGLYVFASSYLALVVLRAIQGFGAALVIPATIALVNEYAASPDERGGNFGVFNTFRLIGFGFGPIVAGGVVEAGPYVLPFGTYSGFDMAFISAFVVAYLSFGLVYFLVHDTDESGAAASKDVSISVRGDSRILDPVFALGLATVVMGLCIALFATLQVQVNARLDQPPMWFGIQFAAVVIANVAFQVPVGRACDRFGRRPFLLVGFLLLIPTTLLQGVVMTSVGMVGIRFLQGIAVALVFAPSLALAGDVANKGESGSTLSVLTMGFGLGVALGPLTSGWLVSYGFIVPFAAGAGLSVIAFLTVVSQVSETYGPGQRAAAPTTD